MIECIECQKNVQGNLVPTSRYRVLPYQDVVNINFTSTSPSQADTA